MDGLGSVHLWAKRRAGQSSVGCQAPGIAHWVSPYALSPTHLPLMPTVHLRLSSPVTPRVELQVRRYRYPMTQGSQFPTDTRAPL